MEKAASIPPAMIAAVIVIALLALLIISETDTPGRNPPGPDHEPDDPAGFHR